MNPKTKILFFVGLLFLGLIFPLHQARASVFGHIFSILFKLVAELSVNFADTSIDILIWVTGENFIAWSYTGMDNPAIQEGWRLTRDFVNMLFIIVLAFIGLATALRIREYEAQKLLPILLITLFLVNFSNVICGIVVDVSNIVMNHFLGAYGQGRDSVRTKLDDIYEKNVLNLPWWGSIDKEMPGIAKMVAISIFNFTAGIIYFLFCFIFAFRYLAIWMCVILSPIAFGANVLPNTRGFYKKWWGWFLQWCFIGIIAVFFLYLGDHIIVKADTAINTSNLDMGEGSANFLQEIIQSIAPMLVGLGFLMFGFQSALSGGAMGAQYAIGAAKWTGGKVAKLPGVNKLGPPKEWAGKAKDWAGSKARNFAREHTSQGVRERLQKYSTFGANSLMSTQGDSGLKRFGKWMGRNTVGRAWAIPRAIGKLALPESELEEIETIKTEIKKEKSNEAKLNWFRANMEKSRAHRVAFMQAAKEEGILEDLTGLPNGLKEKEILRMGSDAAKVGSEAFAPIMKAYPTLVGKMLEGASWATKEKLGLSTESMTDWATKNAEKIVHEFGLTGAGDITNDFVEKNLEKLQGMKITSKLKPVDYANVSFDHLDWDAIHLFASGRELGAGAREMGSKFVDRFTEGKADPLHPIKGEDDRGEEFYKDDLVTGIKGINTKIGRYLDTSAAQELGFRPPIMTTPPPTPGGPVPPGGPMPVPSPVPPGGAGPQQKPPGGPKSKKGARAGATSTSPPGGAGPKQKPPGP